MCDTVEPGAGAQSLALDVIAVNVGAEKEDISTQRYPRNRSLTRASLVQTWWRLFGWKVVCGPLHVPSIARSYIQQNLQYQPHLEGQQKPV